jgi:hypothetical protein
MPGEKPFAIAFSKPLLRLKSLGRNRGKKGVIIMTHIIDVKDAVIEQQFLGKQNRSFYVMVFCI